MKNRLPMDAVRRMLRSDAVALACEAQPMGKLNVVDRSIRVFYSTELNFSGLENNLAGWCDDKRGMLGTWAKRIADHHTRLIAVMGWAELFNPGAD